MSEYHIILPCGHALRRDPDKRLWSICLPGHKWVATDFVDADARAFAASMNAAQATVPPSRADGAEPVDIQEIVFEICERGNGGCACKVQKVNLAAVGFGAQHRGARCDERYDVAMAVASALANAAPTTQPGAAGQGVSGLGGVQSGICSEIQQIMKAYRDQEAKGSIDTPGGLEHIGDVWRMLSEWDEAISAAPTPAATPSGGAAVAVEEVERLIQEFDEALSAASHDQSGQQEYENYLLARAALLGFCRRLAAPQDHGAVRDAALEEAIAAAEPWEDHYRPSPFAREAVRGCIAAIRALKTNTDKPGREGEGSDGWPAEARAREIYEGWKDQSGWVPWVEHGNSDKQWEARMQARREISPAPRQDGGGQS